MHWSLEWMATGLVTPNFPLRPSHASISSRLPNQGERLVGQVREQADNEANVVHGWG